MVFGRFCGCCVAWSLLFSAQGYDFTDANWQAETKDTLVMVLHSTSTMDAEKRQREHRGVPCAECEELERLFAKLTKWGKEHVPFARIGTVDCGGSGAGLCDAQKITPSNMRYGWGGKLAMKEGGLKGWTGRRINLKGGLDIIKKWMNASFLPHLKPGEPVESMIDTGMKPNDPTTAVKTDYIKADSPEGKAHKEMAQKRAEQQEEDRKKEEVQLKMRPFNCELRTLNFCSPEDVTMIEKWKIASIDDLQARKTALKEKLEEALKKGVREPMHREKRIVQGIMKLKKKGEEL